MIPPHLQSPKTSEATTQNISFYHQPNKAINKGVAGYNRPYTHQNIES